MRSILLAAAGAAAGLLLCPSDFFQAALAAEIDAASKIDAVTVYPDDAIVSRVVDVSLPQGASVLAFKGLPLALDPASLRIEAEAGIKLTIGAVETQVAPAPARGPDDPIEVKLATLRSEREAQQSIIDALNAKRSMIVRFSQAGPEKFSPDAKPLDVSQWSAAWDAVASGLTKLGDDLRPAIARARGLDEEIRALEAERQQPGPGQGAQRIATATIAAEGPTQAKIRLSYRVGGVGWRSAYDAALDTGASANALSLTRRAILQQRTGEDWRDVALTVSTARVARATNAPDVQPLTIDFWQPPIAVSDNAGMHKAAAVMRAAPQESAAPRPAPAGEAVAMAPAVKAQEATSQVEAGAYSAEFKAPGRISLASDGSQKSLVLSKFSVQPALLAKAAPGLDPNAYLQARFVAPEDAPLLAGDVALYRDGAYIGQTRIGFVAPGESLDLGFGADDKIKIRRAPVNRKDNDPSWYNQSRVQTREFTTSVRNLHDFPVKLQLIDQAPVSANTAITVELLPVTTPPTEKQVADKRGVMSWTLPLAPGETRDVRLAYRVRWPADRDVATGGAE